MSSRARAMAAIASACVGLSLMYTWFSVERTRDAFDDRTLPAIVVPSPVSAHEVVVNERNASASSVSDERANTEGTSEAAEAAAETGAPAATPVMFVRHTGLDRSFGVMAVDSGAQGATTRRATELRCDRVYFSLDRGVCLTTDRLYTTQSLIVFDEHLNERHRLHLSGLPSRARVSADGRLAATTVFVTGHSYSDGAFSTETGILDTHSGELVIPNLQNIPVILDGQPIAAIDLNVWGVTFLPDNDGFYATVATGGRTYLAQGSVSSRRMRVLREGVECPSVSPDGRLIAFKKRVPGAAVAWRIHVMNATDLQEWPAGEWRSVDDQIEWLDADRLVYAMPRAGAPVAVTDLWTVAADGSGEATLVAADAASPAVVRAGVWVSAGAY